MSTWLDEECALKAYGLVGGRLLPERGEALLVFPLQRNMRDHPDLRAGIDRDMDEFAIRSQTPLERRGWVADPREVLRAEAELDKYGGTMFGGYHMHRVPWTHDPLRDTCTALDTRLTEGSGLWVFILSIPW